jgi:hypothetical protein
MRDSSAYGASAVIVSLTDTSRFSVREGEGYADAAPLGVMRNLKRPEWGSVEAVLMVHEPRSKKCWLGQRCAPIHDNGFARDGIGELVWRQHSSNVEVS